MKVSFWTTEVGVQYQHQLKARFEYLRAETAGEIRRRLAGGTILGKRSMAWGNRASDSGLSNFVLAVCRFLSSP